MKNYKYVSESVTTMTEVVCPNDTNPMNILLGGKLMQWMDFAAAICAQTHAGCIAVTASIDSVIFRRSARLGDIVSIEAKVTRAFNSSMEIYVEVWARKVGEEKYLTNYAYFTFVAIDENARPKKVPAVKPVGVKENKEYRMALQRRKERTAK